MDAQNFKNVNPKRIYFRKILEVHELEYCMRRKCSQIKQQLKEKVNAESFL